MNLPTIEENEIEICIPAKSSGGDVLDVTFVVGQSAKPIRHDVTVGTILWPVTFDIENRRTVEEVQTLHEKPVSFPFDQTHERKSDGIGPRGRIQSENAKQWQLFQFEASSQEPSRLYLQRADLFGPKPVEVD